ncbi:occludin [Bacteroides sp.]|uniref:occludin n=1 Tax=Bacteroides sp. TaxID=29523 RepID=UPI00261A8BA6|nr:occludin [Bacteroides sp.]
MKRIFFCIITLLTSIITINAQNEVVASDDVPPSGRDLMPNVKNYDGFLLDMGLMNVSAPKLPKFTLEIPDASKDYSRIFQLNPDVTYSQGLSNIFSLNNSQYFSSNPFGLTGFWNSTDNLQMGSFKLKNGMRINTYGEYDKDGWKVRNPSALPWEKNNFKGAFELKSSNGSFGIRIEVQQGRNGMY